MAFPDHSCYIMLPCSLSVPFHVFEICFVSVAIVHLVFVFSCLCNDLMTSPANIVMLL